MSFRREIMFLKKVIIEGFRSFGNKETILLDGLTTFIGNNGAGKTTALQALNKMFSVHAKDRIIEYSDFFIASDEGESMPDEKKLSCEAIFNFKKNGDIDDQASAGYFDFLTVDGPDEVPYLRVRLEATWKSIGGVNGTVESNIYFITQPFGEKIEDDNKIMATRFQLNPIRMIYVPAVRNPAQQLKSTSGSLLTNLINNINWSDETKDSIQKKIAELNQVFLNEKGSQVIGDAINEQWDKYHSDERFESVKLQVNPTNIEEMTKRTQILFHSDYSDRDYAESDMSDGTRSLFYISNVASALEIEQRIQTELSSGISGDKASILINPVVFTLVAIEEPENHISPQLLGKLVKQLKRISSLKGSQVIVTSHSTAIVKRISPESIRYFRLKKEKTSVSPLDFPDINAEDKAYKFVKRAVQFYPELYFAQLVILCEGDSEEILLPRFLEAGVSPLDEAGISVVPLGGRFVNHLWRLLNQLGIPYITLLDFDCERSGGDWGRIRYVLEELVNLGYDKKKLPSFKDEKGFTTATLERMTGFSNSPQKTKRETFQGWMTLLERYNIFFSGYLDIDFLMLNSYTNVYKNIVSANEGPTFNLNSSRYKVSDCESNPLLTLEERTAYEQKVQSAISDTLKKGGGDGSTYSNQEKELMVWYNYFFLGRGKPETHILAMSQLTDNELQASIPSVIKRLEDKAIDLLSRNK